MTKAQRQDEIQRRLSRSGYVLVSELATDLGVDESTIRRDLGTLHERGLIERTSGGARSTLSSAVIPYVSKSGSQVDAKRAVAREAAKHVADGATIVLDSGSTTLEVARELRERSGLTVVTNDLAIAGELALNDGIQLVVAGGMRVPSVFTLVSESTVPLLEQLNIDLAILGTDAIDPSGISHESGLELLAKRAMVERARRVIVVVDHTKFGARRLVRVARLDEVDLIITDEGLDPAIAADYPAFLVRV